MVQVIGLCSATSVAKNFILPVNYYLLKVPGLKRRDVCLVPRTGQSIVQHRPMILQVAATRRNLNGLVCVWLWWCFIWSKLFLVQSILLDRKRILADRKSKDCFRARPWQIPFQFPMAKRVDDSDDSSIEEIHSGPQVSFKNPAPCQLYLANGSMFQLQDFLTPF